MDYTLDQVEPGRVRFRGRPAFGRTNPMGGVHGGRDGTLLDSRIGCAVMTRVPKGSVYTTLEYKINITRALPVETEILAEGTVLHGGSSTAVATGETRAIADGRLYATGTTTGLIMTPSEGRRAAV